MGQEIDDRFTAHRAVHGAGRRMEANWANSSLVTTSPTTSETGKECFPFLAALLGSPFYERHRDAAACIQLAAFAPQHFKVTPNPNNILATAEKIAALLSERDPSICVAVNAKKAEIFPQNSQAR